MWLLACFPAVFLGANDFYIAYAVGLFAGFGMGGAILAPLAMLPDVIELDELQTGLRREGIFFSYFNFCEKLAISGGLALSAYALAIAGYDSDSSASDQPDDVKWVLRFLFSVVPMFMLVLSLIAMRYYPITEKSHKENLAKLQQRKLEQEAASAPLIH